MAAKKARKTKKAPSANPAKGTRRILGSREAWGSVKRGAKKAGAAVRRARKRKPATAATVAKHRLTTRKPNGKTIIKAKRVTILNLKKNPAFEILKEATPATKGSQSGWKLGKSFYAKGRGQAKLPGGALLDLGSGFVYRRVANPKRRKNVQFMAGGGTYPVRASWDYDPVRAGETRQSRADYFSRPHVIGGKKVSGAKLKKIVEQKQRKAVLAAQERLDKARASKDAERIEKAKLHLSDTREKVKAAKVTGGARKTDKQTAARRVGRQQVKAETKARKATTTRLASRLLDRSGPKTKRRNPLRIQGVQVKLTPYKPGRTWGDDSRVKQSERGYRVALRRNDGRWWEIGHIKPIGGGKWEATYGDGYWMPAGSSAQGAASALISEVKRLDPEEFKSYYGQTRRNPNADTKSAYESFQGKPSNKSTSLNFPNGTPANVYKLGTLHSITLQSGAVVKPTGKTVWLCADTKGRLHLGTSGERLVNAPKGALGKVREVEYITTKPHLGDSRPTRYYHELGEETGQKPTLYSDGAGGLVFKGGATYVTREGIRN